MTDIYPTHSCFDDALDLIELLVKQDRWLLTTREFILVHAICEVNGERYAHAWVERNDRRVLFAGIQDGTVHYFEADKDEYYKDMGVTETTKYTILEAGRENLKSHNFGPWEEKYRALCGRGKKIIDAPIQCTLFAN